MGLLTPVALAWKKTTRTARPAASVSTAINQTQASPPAGRTGSCQSGATCGQADRR